MRVSVSRVNKFRRCNYSHYVSYVLKIQKKEVSQALTIGSVIHECLEYLYSGRDWKIPYFVALEEYNNLAVYQKANVDNIPDIVRLVMLGYIEHMYTKDKDTLKVIETEKEINLNIETPHGKVELLGYVDGIVDIKGKLYILEHKTSKVKPNLDLLMFNPQVYVYYQALTQLGYKIDGVVWNYLITKPQIKPAMLKNGKMSLSKKVANPYTIKEGIRELGLDANDYKDFVDKHQYKDFYIREILPISPAIAGNIYQDFIATVAEIQQKGNTSKVKNLNFNCIWCSFKDLCHAEITNMDTDYIIKTNYMTKKWR